jgi:hypothetical protein
MASGAQECEKEVLMRGVTFVLISTTALGRAVPYMAAAPQQGNGETAPIFVTLAGLVVSTTPACQLVDGDAAPIYRVRLPAGYRDWTLISVARVGTPVNDMRAKLGNDVAIEAYRAGKKLLSESFVAGPATNVQFMVKDSTKYASTGGRGFAQFTDGKPDGEPLHKTCFPYHAPAKDRGFVFTRYSR